MTLVWVFLIFFIFFVLASSLGVGYTKAKGTIGREAAQRNLRFTILSLLALFTIYFLIFRNYGISGCTIFSSVTLSTLVGVWLLGWISQKQKAGSLLLDVGRNPQYKFMLWVGLLEAAVAALQTLVLFSQVSQKLPLYMSLKEGVFQVIFYWSFAIYLIASGLSRLEFRENGTCFMYSLIVWQRVNSYKWEQTRPNILTIRFKPWFSFFPGIVSMNIPAKHRNTVSQILNERVPNQNL